MHFCGVENINGGNDHFKENFTQNFNDYYYHLLFYHIAKGVYFFFETCEILTLHKKTLKMVKECLFLCHNFSF